MPSFATHTILMIFLFYFNEFYVSLSYRNTLPSAAERTKQKMISVKSTDQCRDSRVKVEIPLEKPVGTIKCKNRVIIIKKRIPGFDAIETRLQFLPLNKICFYLQLWRGFLYSQMLYLKYVDVPSSHECQSVWLKNTAD